MDMIDIKDRNTQIILGAVVIVLVVALAWWYMAHRTKPAEMATEQGATTTEMTPSTSGDTKMTNPTVVASGDSISVADQPAGDSVRVKSVSFSQAGWVAVRDSNGRTLGAGWFAAGAHENVSVPLLRNTEAGQRYQVLLYVDNSGDHKFDLHGDTLIVNQDGSVAGTNFTALNGD